MSHNFDRGRKLHITTLTYTLVILAYDVDFWLCHPDTGVNIQTDDLDIDFIFQQ